MCEKNINTLSGPKATIFFALKFGYQTIVREMHVYANSFENDPVVLDVSNGDDTLFW